MLELTHLGHAAMATSKGWIEDVAEEAPREAKKVMVGNSGNELHQRELNHMITTAQKNFNAEHLTHIEKYHGGFSESGVVLDLLFVRQTRSKPPKDETKMMLIYALRSTIAPEDAHPLELPIPSLAEKNL